MFCLDLRSLAVMRIAYGLLILTDLGIRSVSLNQHYTEAGAFPLELVFSMGLQPDQFSLHVLSGLPEYQFLLFGVHGLAAILLLLGWRTRLMTVLCFILAVSLQNRNFLVLNGGDNWMRLVLFWAMFLPWGDRFSLDAQKRPSPPENTLANVATVGLILQVMAVYFVSALYKTGPAWRTEGSAAFLALKQLEWSSDLGQHLLYYPNLLTVLSLGIFYFEILGPWLLISPFWSAPLRAFAAICFIGFHTGLEVTMELGVFPYVGICTLLGLLPAFLWDSRLGKRIERRLDKAFRDFIGPDWALKYAGSSRPLTRTATTGLLSLVIVLTLYLNAAGQYGQLLPVNSTIGSVAKVLGLNQYWGLFAPEPGRRGGWFVFEGFLSDGSRVDLTTGGALDWREPKSSSIYKTQRIKRWNVALSMDDYKQIRAYHARFLLRQWDLANTHHDTRLQRVRGHYLSRPSLVNYEDPGLPSHYIFMDFTREQLEAL